MRDCVDSDVISSNESNGSIRRNNSHLAIFTTRRNNSHFVTNNAHSTNKLRFI